MVWIRLTITHLFIKMNIDDIDIIYKSFIYFTCVVEDSTLAYVVGSVETNTTLVVWSVERCEFVVIASWVEGSAELVVCAIVDVRSLSWLVDTENNVDGNEKYIAYFHKWRCICIHINQHKIIEILLTKLKKVQRLYFFSNHIVDAIYMELSPGQYHFWYGPAVMILHIIKRDIRNKILRVRTKMVIDPSGIITSIYATQVFTIGSNWYILSTIYDQINLQLHWLFISNESQIWDNMT